MEPINYGLSFISCKWPENRVRFWVESRVRFVDEMNNIVKDYYKCGSSVSAIQQ
jgi:hypothetical protein